jgi:ankyrin repeat protein
MEEGIEDIDKQDDGDMWTQLHHHAFVNNIAGVKYLLKQKANPHLCSREGNSPLNIAIFYSHEECIRLLLALTTKEHLSVLNIHCNNTLDVALTHGNGRFTSLIYDAGGRTKRRHKSYETLILKKLIHKRKNIKSVLVVFFALGKKTKRIHKDLISTIGKMIWETRDEEVWSFQHSKKQKK